MARDQQISGGLFDQIVEGASTACQISVSATALRVETKTGQRFDLPLRDMQVEIGGASGKMLFCRPPARDLTIFSEDPHLVSVWMAVAPGPLVIQLEAVEKLLPLFPVGRGKASWVERKLPSRARS